MIRNDPPITKESADWTKLKLWLATQIRKDQTQLEAVGATEAVHNATRGRISAYRDLILAVEPRVLVELEQAEDHYDGN